MGGIFLVVIAVKCCFAGNWSPSCINTVILAKLTHHEAVFNAVFIFSLLQVVLVNITEPFKMARFLRMRHCLSTRQSRTSVIRVFMTQPPVAMLAAWSVLLTVSSTGRCPVVLVSEQAWLADYVMNFWGPSQIIKYLYLQVCVHALYSCVTTLCSWHGLRRMLEAELRIPIPPPIHTPSPLLSPTYTPSPLFPPLHTHTQPTPPPHTPPAPSFPPPQPPPHTYPAPPSPHTHTHTQPPPSPHILSHSPPPPPSVHISQVTPCNWMLGLQMLLLAMPMASVLLYLVVICGCLS